MIKKKIGEIIIQIIPVMIGVYLGFLVSDRADIKKRKNQSMILVENILSEMAANSQKIAGVKDYHIMVMDSSQFYSNPNNKIKRKRLFFQGIRMSALTSSAYNTGIQTGILNELPLKKIQALNELYTQQDSYNDYANMILDGFLNKDFSNNEEALRKIIQFLSMTMTDVVYKEKSLSEAYESVTKILEED